MSDEFRSIIVGTVGLSVAVTVAALLTALRVPRPVAVSSLPHLRLIAGLAVVFHIGHFAEELYTGFYRQFPEMLGLVPWSETFFVSLNLAWIAVWIFSIGLMNRPRRVLFFPLWFLALASAVNGIVHPLISAVSGRYFPGLWSSPFVGIAGLLLLWALRASTQPAGVRHGQKDNIID